MSHVPARRATLVAAALAVVGASLASGSAVGAAHASGHVRPTSAYRAGAHKILYFEKTSSFKQGKKSLEFTDYLYVGDHTSHAKKYTGTDHVEVDLSKESGNADAQFAIGGANLLLVRGTGTSGGTFTLPIIGGTGKLLGAKGTVKVTDLPSGDSDLVITYTLPS